MIELPNNGNVGNSASRQFLDLAGGLAGIVSNVAGAVRGSAGNGTEPTVKAPAAAAPPPPSNMMLYIALGLAGVLALIFALKR